MAMQTGRQAMPALRLNPFRYFRLFRGELSGLPNDGVFHQSFG